MYAGSLAALLFIISLAGASSSLIVDGKEAKAHSRPYMASLQVQGVHVCGGFLIREDFVLTAAHCQQEQPVTVVLGAHNLRQDEKSQQKIAVGGSFPHPDYRVNQYRSDIMLLKLQKKATIGKEVKVINLPKKDKKIPANTVCQVAGWGMRRPGTKPSPVLLESEVKTQFDFECKALWEKHFLSEQMICTLMGKKKGGICQGDSGGPLIWKDKAVGVASFTKEYGCDDPKSPHVFIKVTAFLDWMNDVMKKG